MISLNKLSGWFLYDPEFDNYGLTLTSVMVEVRKQAGYL